MRRAIRTAICLVFLDAAVVWASVGVQMSPSDSFFPPSDIRFEHSMRTSFGEVLPAGKYTLRIVGTGRTGEVVLNFLDGKGKLAGKTLGYIRLLMTPVGTVGDPHRTFASLDFGPSSVVNVKLLPTRGVDISLQSDKAKIDGQLAAVP